MPKKTVGNLAIASYDDIFTGANASTRPQAGEQIHCVSLNELYDFEGHPFQVHDDSAMRKLVKSVEKLGVLDAAIVRPRKEGGYEILAGHRRKLACTLAGLNEMPVVIRDVDDDIATLIMVDSNLEQRETLLPSEKAWAYRMKLEALNHRGLRSNEPGQLSVDILAEQTSESKNQIFRFVRLTELIPELLSMVDDKVDGLRIAFNPAVELSYLQKPEQEALLDMIGKYVATPSLSQSQRMKKHSQAGTFTSEVMDAIMSEEKKTVDKVTLTSGRLKQYFPQSYTPKQMETVILRLLEGWYKKQQAPAN